MAQIRSTYLHRIPYSMVWNNAIFDFNNPWDKIFNNTISKTILNSFINYSNKLDKKNWNWNDLFFSYNIFFKNITFVSKLTSRIYNNTFFNKNSILKNSNKGTNLSIQGKTNFFDYNNNLYCLNSYYLQNFSKIKKTKKTKNKNFLYIFYSNKINYIFKKYKAVYKQSTKHDYKKINEYKNLLKSLIINKKKKIVMNIKLIENNYFYFYKQNLINYYKNNFLHFFNDNIFLLNKKTKNEDNKNSELKKKPNKKTKNNNNENSNNNSNNENNNNNSNNENNNNNSNNENNNSNNENNNNNNENNNKKKNEDKTKKKTKKKKNIVEPQEETLEMFLKDTLNYYNGEFNVKPNNNVSEIKRKELVEILKTNIDENLKYILKEVIEENSSDIINEILTSNPNEIISDLLRNKKIPKFKYILAESLYENNEENPLYEEELSIENEEKLLKEAHENLLKKTHENSINNYTEKSTIINLEIGPNHRFYVDDEKKEIDLNDKEDDEKYEFNDVFYNKEIDYNYINHKYNRKYYNDDDYENFHTEFKNLNLHEDNLSEFDDDDTVTKKK